MAVPKVSLDTSLVFEYWKRQSKAEVIKQLLKLAEEGAVELAITSRIRADIPHPPLADRINELSELNVLETGSVARLGSWVLGQDMLGRDDFANYWSTKEFLGKKAPDWRDQDHLHTHYLMGRDVFLTWDRGILRLANDLNEEFGIVIMAPEDYLQEHEDQIQP